VRPDGVIEGSTREGEQLIELLRLNRPALTRFRGEMLELERLALTNPLSEMATRLRDLQSFPDDVPDLAGLHPPAGNKRPAGIAHSYFVQRRHGTLSATY
jgi:hypothetical protein